MTQETSLLRASASPALGTALSRATGLIRVAAMAAALGQGGVSDGFNLANTAPNLIYELVLGGVLSSTLVPVFVRAKGESAEAARERASVVASVSLVALVVLSVGAVLISPALVGIIPATTDGAAIRTEVAGPLLALLLPQILFYGVTSVGTAILHAHRRFAVAAFAPVLTNIITTGVFIAVAIVTDTAEDVSQRSVILLLGLGTTAGVAAMAVCVALGLRSGGIRLQWMFRPRHPVIGRIGRLAGWTIGYVAANQIALLVVLAVAAGQGDGVVTAYQTAFIFFQLPHGLLAVSIMTSATPELARAAADGESTRFAERFREGSLVILALMVPAAIGLAVLAHPLVELLLERGRFTPADTDRTAAVLAGLAVGLPAFSMYLFTLRVFTARGDTRTPFFCNVIQNATNIVLVLVVAASTGTSPAGLGLAYAGSYLLAAGVTLARAGQVIPGLVDRTWRVPVVRVGVMGLALVLLLLGARAVLDVLGFDGALVEVFVLSGLGAAGVAFAVPRLGIDGFDELIERVRRGTARRGP